MLSQEFMLDCFKVYLDKVEDYKAKGFLLPEAHRLADDYIMEVFFKDIDIEKELNEAFKKCVTMDAEIRKLVPYLDPETARDVTYILDSMKDVCELAKVSGYFKKEEDEPQKEDASDVVKSVDEKTKFTTFISKV